MLSLPHDIQELIWKTYYTTNVIIEIKESSVSMFLMDTSKTTRENDMIMMRYNTDW